MVRRIAVRILADVHRSRAIFAADRIHGASREENLRKRDRRFLTELVFGVLRHQDTLDCILRAFSRRPLQELEHKVREALRLGVYQLLYLDGVPAFAAIHETVEALPGDPRRRAFANGVLRAVDREVRRLPIERDRGGASPRKRLQVSPDKVCFFPKPVFTDPEHDRARYLAEVYSHGPKLVARWLERHGPEVTEAMLAANNETPTLFVRRNALRGSRDQLIERLHREEVRCHPGNLPDSVRVEAPPTELLRSRAFREGWCSVQDETAMKVAPMLEPAAGQRILDLCAAPGGKTLHLAELTGDAATIVAVDRDGRRLQMLQEGLTRLRLSSVQVVEADLLEQEAPEPLRQPFDRILVDAPCSNSGVLGRRPEARRRLEETGAGDLPAIQAGLLDRAAERLAADGVLVYSTCSIEPDENQQQVAAFLERHGDFTRDTELETLPRAAAGDGGYLAVLRRAP